MKSKTLIEAYERLWQATEDGTVGEQFFELREDFRNLMQKQPDPENHVRRIHDVGIPIGTITLKAPCKGMVECVNEDGQDYHRYCRRPVSAEATVYFDKEGDRVGGITQVICDHCKCKNSIRFQGSSASSRLWTK